MSHEVGRETYRRLWNEQTDRADKAEAERDRYREALHDIHEQATRKNRANGTYKYLIRDLDFIAEKALVGGE